MIRIRQIKIEVSRKSDEHLKQAIAKKIHVPLSNIINYEIYKESIDARNKNEIYFVYEVNVSVLNEEEVIKKCNNKDVFIALDETYNIPKKGLKKLKYRPIIVGTGPAGLFAGLILAEANYQPILIERGECVEKRISSVEDFWNTGKLNPNSNVQFGEGGAGTFSDGKLNTLVKDSSNRMRKVFLEFVRFGAPKEILYSYKPHIGTDILTKVISNMREYIKSLGGTFYYDTCFTDFSIKDGRIVDITINNQDKISCEALVLAIGHSARDTFSLLYEKGLRMEGKPFAVGVRVRHPQKVIDEAQYGSKYASILSPATYKLTYTTSSGRGVYSFCMCPGGYIVNASSFSKGLAINGMSLSKRDSGYANSALVVTVGPKDFGSNPLDGMAFQESLEQKAYLAGQGNIPVQTYKSFKDNKLDEDLTNFDTLKGNAKKANLNLILPSFVSEALKEAIPNMAKKIKHFDDDTTLIAAIESRTSSPVRILRDDKFEANILGIYPCGEGAGYAGGITSAAIDGIKVAEEIIKEYASF